MERLKVLITVKTYPIPSKKYDELVCTAGVREDGNWVRLYPVNFRDLPFSQQYRKYQWIEVMAEKHSRDHRKESYRPDCTTLQNLGEPIPTRNGDWSERAAYVLRNRAQSLEDLSDRLERDNTSLGIFKPKDIRNLTIEPDDPEWKPSFMAALKQTRLWEKRKVSKEPPRKVPFKFFYHFECDDPRCEKRHRISVIDWEVGALYWKLVDKGAEPLEAAEAVRDKFLGEICAPNKDTHFLVGTLHEHPKNWIIIGLWWPKKSKTSPQLMLPNFE